MTNLAIKGHPTRGNEVIEILKMLGGSNPHAYTADTDSLCFFINKNTNIIYYIWVNNCYEDEDILVFTLEEFLEKFPYKVGDKVIYKSEVFPIIGMKWNCCRNIVIYTMKNDCSIIDCYDSTWMKSYKEETMEEIKIDIPKGYEFVGVDDDAQQVVFTKIGYHYPKTYEECYDILGLLKPKNDDSNIFGYRTPLLSKFQKLLICRDAYWKIAGEQLGLDKPWEPDYNEESYEQGSPIKYVIYYTGTYITKGQKCTPSYILAFPSEEMRDAFYENFKELIEECKEFL